MTLYKIAPDVIWVSCLDHVLCLANSGVQVTLTPAIANYWLKLAGSAGWLSLNDDQENISKSEEVQVEHAVKQLRKEGFLLAKLE